MCGIVGASGHPVESQLRLASSLLAHRGPDDSGLYLDMESQVGLAHRRLSIIDTSDAGKQPMFHGDNRQVVIVFNGEIYNFRELRKQLEIEGHIFRGRSDTEVLLALYVRDGAAMLPKLNGIFTFAIFDRRNRELLLARDSFGVKPLYFSEGPRGFVFASEIKALLPLLTGPKMLDPVALSRYLGFLWCPGERTPFLNVRKMSPGEAFIVRDGRITRRWTWYTASTSNIQISDISDADAIQRTRDTFRTAVHRQMVSDVPVGAFLSGGLDSSAVVAMAREVSPNIDCFTIDTGIVQDRGVENDLPYARLAAKHFDVKLHEIKIDPSHLAGALEQMIYQLDEPLADPAPLNVLYISQLARRHGIKVLLSGAGGDDLFSGYRRHHALSFEQYWDWMPQSTRRILRGLAKRVNGYGTWGRRFSKAFAYADFSPDQRLIGYFMWMRPESVAQLFSPEYKNAFAQEDIPAPMNDYLEALPSSMSRLQRLLCLDQRFFLADHNLLYTDKMSMAAGVETRVPFLDNDLVRLANSLPPNLKQPDGEGKWVLRKAMEPYLHPKNLHRPKTGFGTPLRKWLHGELREWVNDSLSPPTLRRRGIFDPKAVASLIANDRAGRIDAAYTIFGLIAIEVWCRRFLDSP